MELSQRGDRSISQIAEDFHLTETAVRLWFHQADTDAGLSEGSGKEEFDRLRRENRRLREDAEILKRATAFLAAETR